MNKLLEAIGQVQFVVPEKRSDICFTIPNSKGNQLVCLM